MTNSFVYYSIHFLIGPLFCLELLFIQVVVRAVAKGKAVEVHTSGEDWINRSLLWLVLLDYGFTQGLARNHSNVQLTGRIGCVFSA